MNLCRKISHKSDQSLPDKTVGKVDTYYADEDASGKRNLHNDGTCNVPMYSMKVYLRLKPCLTSIKSWKSEDVYIVLNHTTLLAKFPTIENNIRNSVKHKQKENANRKYTFTRIFGSDTCQADFFEQSVKSQIDDFLSGQSSTIITYGTANSGKTFTLYGTSESPGIIPRSIEMIFAAVNCTLSPWYKPTNGCSIVSLDETKRTLEDRKKRKILNTNLTNDNQYVEARKSLENSELGVSQNERAECNGENLYSVWLSFAEIYNENVYDLLAEDEESRYFPLKLIKGKDSTAYVSGLKTVYATTALEACQIVVAGQSKMSVAPTILNSRSSRSHTIFTIRLLRYQKEDVPEEVEISTLTFCDLAGSGRSRKTQDADKRLVEARNINNSHLVLGRCLKAVWEGKLNKQNVDNIMGLFRESKLTRLFQGPLIGREPVTFLVTIDSSPDLYVETQSVLNLSAIAKKIDPSKGVRKSVFSDLYSKSSNTQSTSDVMTIPSLTQTPEKASFIDDDLYRTIEQGKDNIVYEIESLRKASSGKMYQNVESSLHRKNSIVVIKDVSQRPTNTCTEEEQSKCKKQLDDSHLFPLKIIPNVQERNCTEQHILLSHELSPQELPSITDDNDDLVHKVESVERLALKREYEIRDELKSHYSSVIEDLEADWAKRTTEMMQNLKVTSTQDVATSPHMTEKQIFLQSEDYLILKNEKETLLKEIETLKTSLIQYERKIREEMADQYTGIIEHVETTWRQRTKEVEEEGQDLLKWSVNQVENFYKERIDSLTRNKKRKRTDCGDQNNEETSLLEELEAENTQITSKVVVLREIIKKLKDENKIISTEKNKCNFELALVKEELKEFQDLARCQLEECISRAQNNKDDNECVRLVDQLKEMIDKKQKTVDNLEKNLGETRSNYLSVTSLSVELKQKLSDANAMLDERQIQINDLKETLVERVNQVKTLQTQLNAREKQLAETRKAMDNAKDKSIITSKRIEVLEDLVENLESKLRPSPSHDVNRKFSDYYPLRSSIGNSSKDSGCKLSTTTDDSIISDEVSNSTLPVFSQIDPVKDIFQRFKLNNSMDTESQNTSDPGRFSMTEISESLDQSIARSSISSGKNDSGINLSLHKTISVDRGVQTITVSDTCTSLTYQPDIQEELNIDEMERLNTVVNTLKQVSHEKDNKINVYENQFLSQNQEIIRLSEEKDKITLKYHELTSTAETKTNEYEKRIHELAARLKIREESEVRTANCLEEFLKRCSNLESQLSVVHSQLEKSTLRCVTEHVPKIEKLEKETFAKTLKVNEMESKITETEKDLARISELNEKMKEFETIVEKSRQEKDDLRRQLNERLENQLTLEFKLKKFVAKVEERENEITSLKAGTGNIIYTNVSNSERVKELNKQIAKMIQSINSIKKDLLHSEELRRNIEKSSREEIATLKLRLASFEKSTAFLSLIEESNNHKQEELVRLKSQLHEKECEMNLFKKNRDEMIEKYESLVKELQGKIEKQSDRPVSDGYPRYIISESTDRSSKVQNLFNNRDSKMTWYYLNKGFADEKSSASSTTLPVSEKCSSQIAAVLSSTNITESTDCTKVTEDEGSQEIENNTSFSKIDSQTQNENRFISNTNFTSALICCGKSNRHEISRWRKIGFFRDYSKFNLTDISYYRQLLD